MPSSRWGSDDDINIRMLQRRRHKWLHDYFDNKVPHEQIMQVLEDSNSVLTRKFKKSILEVLEEYGYENMVYENWVFRHK